MWTDNPTYNPSHSSIFKVCVLFCFLLFTCFFVLHLFHYFHALLVHVILFYYICLHPLFLYIGRYSFRACSFCANIKLFASLGLHSKRAGCLYFFFSVDVFIFLFFLFASVLFWIGLCIEVTYSFWAGSLSLHFNNYTSRTTNVRLSVGGL